MVPDTHNTHDLPKETPDKDSMTSIYLDIWNKF